MAYVPNTAHFRKTRVADAATSRGFRYGEGLRDDLGAMLRGEMLADTPSVRRRILETCGGGGRACSNIMAALGRNVAGGLEVVLADMVKLGLLETREYRFSQGRWRFVKLERRRKFKVWKRTEAGDNALRKIDRRDAIKLVAGGRR